MNWGDWADKYNFFFRFTSWLYKPYLKRKYHPTERVTLEYKLISGFVFVGTWVVVALVYIGLVYFFFYEPTDKIPRNWNYIISQPIATIMSDIYTAISSSIFYHIAFIILMVLSIQARAERDYFRPLVFHSDLLGLIKVIKTGAFDKDSHVIEQDEKQVFIARSNIYATAVSEDKEIIRIMTTSGWDLFGDGPALPQEDEAKANSKKNRFWSKNGKTEQKKWSNGYALGLITGRSRTVEIIMLDPDGDVAKARANEYLGDNGHKAVTSESQYLDGIRTCLRKLAVAKQSNQRITVKIVSDKIPRWKMILVEGEVWAQPIMEGKRSDHTPLYGFKKSPQSLYHYYFNLFDSYWHSSKVKQVNLDDYKA